MAERGGFEPPNGEIPLTVFETAAFDRSAISPEKCEKRVNLIYSAIAKMQARIAFFIVRPARASQARTTVRGNAAGFSFDRDVSIRDVVCAGRRSVFQIRGSSCSSRPRPRVIPASVDALFPSFSAKHARRIRHLSWGRLKACGKKTCLISIISRI